MSEEIVVYRKYNSIEAYIKEQWTRESVGEFELFWNANDKHRAEFPNGFRFDCIRLVSGWNFDDRDAEFETVVDGVAYFDGLRHLNFGDKNEPGYMNYPDSESLVALMTRLHQLEGEYCWDAPQNRGKR